MCRGEPTCSPEDVVLSNRFAKETALSYPGAHIGATAAAGVTLDPIRDRCRGGQSANLTFDREITCIAAL